MGFQCIDSIGRNLFLAGCHIRLLERPTVVCRRATVDPAFGQDVAAVNTALGRYRAL